MAKTTIYFVSDLHGSSRCFRKFVNAAPIYGANVLILGADLAGKAIQQIERQPGGRWTTRFVGREQTVEDGPELAALEKLIADHGYYPYRAEPGELEAMQADGTLDDLYLRLMKERLAQGLPIPHERPPPPRAPPRLMKERLAQWLTIADERLRPHGVPLYFMLGNDDPEELGELLDSAPWGTHCEGKVVWIDDDHEMISWGYSNTTPWHTYREETEPELATAIARSADQLTHPERAIFNLHAPPLATHLDDAPKLDADLQVQAVLGQVQYVPVGSSAVREAELAHQPLLGLHGHIHESPGVPGSPNGVGTVP